MMGLAGAAFALDRAELDERVRKLTAKFEALQSKPDRQVPAETLRQAQGVILLDCTKGGFVLGFENGHGVALVKDPQTRQWSAPAFMKSNEGSLGAQIGGQQSFLVILLMNTNATHRLGVVNENFGGEARGTAGNETAGTQGLASSDVPWVLVFDDRKGLYGGAAIKGGAIAPDNTADRVYYGQYLTVNEIVLERKVKPTEAGQALVAKITAWASQPAKHMVSSSQP